VFASLALGGGYFHASSGAEEDTRTFSGGTFAGQMVLASRIGKGRTVAVGGTYLRDQVFALSSKDEVQDGDEPKLEDIAFGLWMLGFFTDVSFQQAPGLHLQTIVGVAGLSVDGAGRDTDTPSGLGFNLGVGYDLAVGKHLALGGLLRATYAPLDVSEVGGTTVSTLVPSLLLTATTR
jgi:hypothetical protein